MQLHQLHQGNVHGNSATATKLATARNIKLQGAVSGNVNFDGSGNVTITTTQANVAVVEGTMTLAANTSENLASGIEQQTISKINFPSGFNKDNCVCIAFGMKRDTAKNYTYGISQTTTNRNLTGAYYRHAVLGASDDSTKIALQVFNPTTSAVTAYYRIVLMKIA